MEFLQITWFGLWGLLWAAYFMLDGFVRGPDDIPCLGNTTREAGPDQFRGPVWNGNEVGDHGGGQTSQHIYGSLDVQYLYTPLPHALSLIIRGVSLEFRNKHDYPAWKSTCDFGIYISGFLVSFLFGVAFGNIFQGLPMDSSGYHGGILSLLNPYGLLTGLLFVLLFAVHGSLYMGIKTEGDLSQRALEFAKKAWPALAATAVGFLIYTAYATKLYGNYVQTPLLIIVPGTAVAALLGTRIFLAKGASLSAFFASCLTIFFITATGITGLFPNLIPSSLDPAYSMTIYNSSSSRITLTIMRSRAGLRSCNNPYNNLVDAYSAAGEREDTEGGY